MSDGTVHCRTVAGVASVVFDRPEARNAMTWAMYDQLVAACGIIAANPAVRVATFRGPGGRFAAGTDIREFLPFSSAEDGIAYEQRIEAVVSAIENLQVPTIAIIEGAAMGGALLIATRCNIRIAPPSARFGGPVARTLGNCLSLANTARLVSAFGQARVKRLLLLADSISSEEALSCGYVLEVVQPGAIDELVSKMCRRLASHAPITMQVAKESIRRLSEISPPGEDLMRLAYGSEDFKAGGVAFLAKQ